jgi:transcriptional regulator with XRE-family HTH domain
MRKGMTQEELAAKLGLSRFAIAKYESGEREPALSTLTKIADLFNTSTDYILSRTLVETPRVLDKLDYISEIIPNIEYYIDRPPFFSVSKIIEQIFDSLMESGNEERQELVEIYGGVFEELNCLSNDLKLYQQTKDSNILPGIVFDGYLGSKEEISKLIDRLFKLYIFKKNNSTK